MHTRVRTLCSLLQARSMREAGADPCMPDWALPEGTRAVAFGYNPLAQTTMRLHALTLQGFKSFRDRTEVAFGDFTLLAGANNAGKSTLMQPLLLMKQTLEATYDPGPLLLQGANVVFSSAEALFWSARGQCTPQARLGVVVSSGGSAPERFGYEMTLALSSAGVPPLTIAEAVWQANEQAIPVRPGADLAEVRVERCFALRHDDTLPTQQRARGSIETVIRRLIHVPAARSMASLRHPIAAAQSGTFPGRFTDYVPSLIYAWQTLRPVSLTPLEQHLRALDLAARVEAHKVSDLELSLRLSRLTREDAADWVHITEAGAGVAHALPVVVALLAANAGQLVYIEEPEAHLHPRATHALASLIRDAVRRGAQVVVETQSDLLLLSIQALVAQKAFDHHTVRVHWISRDDEGASRREFADLDEQGSFGELPIDLDEVSAIVTQQYLDAALWR